MKKIVYQKKNSLEKKPLSLKDTIFITGGDPAGIGPEIIRKALSDIGNQYSKNLKILYFFNASKKEKESLLTELINWNIFSIKQPQEIPFFSKISDPSRHSLFLFEVGNYRYHRPSEESGYLAFLSLKQSCEWIKQYSTLGLVTAPLSKEWVARKIKNFTGHTRFLAQFFKKKVFMIMYGKEFSVLPLTEHISISKVPHQLKKILEEKTTLELLLKLKRTQLFKEKWAFCGLNPHAGDNGLIGKEELQFIKPFIEEAKKKKISLNGPFPSDSLFTEEKRNHYSLIITCYHDQGLIPFKIIEGREGINLTFGLPFYRTSPDHGTAFDIANKNLADPKSMINAILFHLN